MLFVATSRWLMSLSRVHTFVAFQFLKNFSLPLLQPFTRLPEMLAVSVKGSNNLGSIECCCSV
jgi:hypothetical protein